MLKRVSQALLFVVLALAGFAAPAAAGPVAAGDEIKNFAIGYTVSADGVLHVKETIAYHFGGSGRHGIFRDLVVREPYKDDVSLDQKYEVSNIAVQSDAPDQFSTETTKTNAERDETLRIKIGSETQTVPGYDASYVITYDVRGALRHFADHSELYWDATGSAWDAVIDQVTVKVAVPQGVRQVQCFTGLAGATQTCPQMSVAAGKASFGASQLLRENQLTIVAGIKAGAVQNDTPILATPPSWMERNGLSWLAVAASSVLTVIALVFGVIYHRMAGRDQRYAGMPPGTVPPEGASAPVAKDHLAEDQLPVAFSPPKIPVAEGGVLTDSKATTTEVAATLIDLAVRGGVRIDNTRGIAQKVILVDPAVATARHEQMLLHGLFPSMKPGAERLLLPSAVCRQQHGAGGGRDDRCGLGSGSGSAVVHAVAAAIRHGRGQVHRIRVDGGSGDRRARHRGISARVRAGQLRADPAARRICDRAAGGCADLDGKDAAGAADRGRARRHGSGDRFPDLPDHGRGRPVAVRGG